MSKTSITVQGLEVEIELPYAEGHVLSITEANALNQTFAENVRNNTASVVKKALEAAASERGENAELNETETSATTLLIQDYAGKYTFQGRKAPSAPLDPVKREAHKLARAVLGQILAQKERKFSDLKDGEYEKYIDLILANKPDLTEEAQRRVDAAKAATGDIAEIAAQIEVASKETPVAQGDGGSAGEPATQAAE